MPHFEGPYVSAPSENHPGFCIYRTRNGEALALPIAIVPVNLRDPNYVAGTARLLAAAPMLLKSLEVLAAAHDLDPDLRVIAQHAIESATKEKN